jgi:hypothetical protein
VWVLRKFKDIKMNNLQSHRPVGCSDYEIKSLSNLVDSLVLVLIEAQISFVNNTLILSIDMLNELALVIAEFFEDIILNIGILVQWNKEWYWSGLQSSLGQVSQKRIEEIKSEFIKKSGLIVYRYCKSLLARAKAQIKIHYQNFVNFHGDDIVIFPDGYSMAASIQKQHRLEYEAVPQDILKKIMKDKNLKNPWPNYSYPQELLESKNGIGLFFNPNEGQEIMLEFNNIVNGLKKKGKNLSEDEMDFIKVFIESEKISPDFVKKMVNKYGNQSIAELYLIRDTENYDFLTYLLRKYKGQYFRNRYPNITLNDVV